MDAENESAPSKAGAVRIRKRRPEETCFVVSTSREI